MSHLQLLGATRFPLLNDRVVRRMKDRDALGLSVEHDLFRPAYAHRSIVPRD
jgi:hypothetical protein